MEKRNNNKGNGSEFEEMEEYCRKWFGIEKWKNKEGNGTEWSRDGIIMKEMVRNGSTA